MGGELASIWIFAYGSLMYEPELADEIVASQWVTLAGHRRVFNKWSQVRGCKPEDARWPDVEVPNFFVTDTLNRSLVLGTEPGHEMIGLALSYPKSLSKELLARLDKREGFYANRSKEESGYLRREVTVTELVGGEALHAWTYLRNPDSEFYVPNLDIETVAKVLARATPRKQVSRKVKGLNYFTGIALELRRRGILDNYTETLWDTLSGISTEVRQCLHLKSPSNP
jgi:cation transport regulator ChaC